MFKKICICVMVFALLLVGWEIATHVYENLRFLLPAPSRVFFVLWNYSDRLFYNSMVTLKEMLGGFVLAFVCAFPLAMLMAYYRSLRPILQPIFVTTQCIPMFALAPIMVLWFGWSYTAIVVPTAIMIFFPLTLNIYQGLCATPTNLIEFFRLHEATAFQQFFKLQLPWALPYIFAGFRISVAMAGIGAVAGEWAGGQEGLGILMLESRRSADIEVMFGALFCITGMSLLFYGLVAFFEGVMSERQHRKKLVGGLPSCLLIVMMVCVGCQSSSSPKQEKTMLLDWLPNPDHIPLYVGVEKGFFREQGIPLKILKITDPSDTIPYITSKQVDLCITYMPHALQALSHGAPIVPVGILVEEPLNALIFRAGEGIINPQDLNDKVLGYSIDDFQNRFLKLMFKQYRINPREWRNTSFDLVGMLATKNVDVIFGAYWNIETENLREYGVETNYFPLSDFGVPPYYELLVFARRDSPESRPDFVVNFKKALQDSINFSRENPKEAFEIYLKTNPDKSSRTQVWEWRAWLKTIPTLAKQQEIDPNVWNNFMDWLIENGLLDR